MSVLVCDAGIKKTLGTLACHIKMVKNVLRDFPATPEFFLSVFFFNLVHPVIPQTWLANGVLTCLVKNYLCQSGFPIAAYLPRLA